MTDQNAPAVPSSYSTAEVARRLGVSIPTVQRWVDSGHLKAWKTVGGHRRIESESAERMFMTQEARLTPDSAAEGPLTVLVVDDNAVDRDILVLLVETSLPGAKVTVAENGFEALVAVGQRAPDIVITDIAMPNMDGFEMLRHLSTQCKVRPRLIVAVSSRSNEQLCKMGELPPEVKYVAKPIDQQVFAEVVQTAVQGFRPSTV